MRKHFLVISLALLFLSVVSLRAANIVGVSSSPPLVSGMGGPDDYGYYWIDSDTVGGPTYQWVDITTKPGAVEVTQFLGDDNNCGPFAIGFDFNYYWYTVDEVIIGSNGYVSFTDRDNYAHPFSELPSEARPNNLVCPLAGDIDFTRGTPECWYWSNGVDSFVVSWIEVAEFYPDPNADDSVHTFQLILTEADTSLYFMYGEQKGHYEAGSGSYVIGMEDVSGTVGLQYCRDGVPYNNVFHEELAIHWYVIPDPTFEFYDLGVENAMVEGSRAHIAFPGDDVVLTAEYKNNGTHTQSDIETRVIVRDPTGTEVMRDTVFIASLDPQESEWVEYSPSLTPGMTGEYAVEFRLYVSDRVPGNNRKIAELRVAEYGGPGTEAVLLWDDTTLESCSSWQGDSGGYANEFEAPEAFKIKEVYMPIQGVSGGSAGDLIVRVYGDDGAGNPGDLIAEKIVYVPYYQYFQWDTVDFRGENIIVDGHRVWITGIHATENTFAFCHDATYTSPRSNRGWEYTGMLATDRNRETQDVAIRMLVEWASAELSMSCETLSPTFCRGKNFYFAVTYSNNTPSAINTVVTLRGYSGFGCDPGGILITIPRNRTIPLGTNTYYYFLKVPNAVSGDLSAGLEFDYQGSTYSCCMNTTAIQCNSWMSGDGEWEWVEVGRQQVELSCEPMTPSFCRGKNFYFTTTVTNNTGGNISGTLTFSGYSGYNCDPGHSLVAVPSSKTYEPGVTERHYFFKVPAAAVPGPYSASVSGRLSGHDVYCCMNLDILQCQGWKLGDNTEWELVEVGREGAALPSVTSLGQNYPNPFNATTTISYDLASAGNVSLKVYDISGRLAATLVDGQVEAGSHSVDWDASGVSSGVYFYKLVTSDYTCTKKMNLLK